MAVVGGTIGSGHTYTLFETDQYIEWIELSEPSGSSRQQAEMYLESHAAALRAAEIQVESDVRVGVPHRSIAECADALPEPLIALATHGYGGPRRWAVGSVADKVNQAARACLSRTQPGRRAHQRAGVQAHPGAARWVGAGGNGTVTRD